MKIRELLKQPTPDLQGVVIKGMGKLVDIKLYQGIPVLIVAIPMIPQEFLELEVEI